MPKKNNKMEGEIKARCYKNLELEMVECANNSNMVIAEYIRAAIREKNEKTKAK